MNKQKLKKLHKIYRKIPTGNCKGLCQGSCSLIGMEKGEYERLTQVSGKEPFFTEEGSCGYLVDGRCSVYNDRPTICRLYGVTEKLPCNYGCNSPTVLSENSSQKILGEVQALVGGDRMYVNITRELALKIDRGEALGGPPSNTSLISDISIVPYKKKD